MWCKYPLSSNATDKNAVQGAAVETDLDDTSSLQMDKEALTKMEQLVRLS